MNAKTPAKHSVTHNTFTIERVYPVVPAKVFAAFADPKLKGQWFQAPKEWNNPDVQTMDFRVGGKETSVGGPKGGPVIAYAVTFQDIVANERIVTTYDMTVDKKRISVSLSTLELRAEGKGTRLVLTEQGAYLDGSDTGAQRKEGTEGLLDALGTFLTSN